MGVFTWLDRLVARVPLIVAVALPVAAFLVVELAIQLVILQVWGSTDSLVRWEWSAITVPLLAFIPAYFVAVVAVSAQMKRSGWWRLLDSNRSLDTIRSLPWREFERLVAAGFTAKGWSAELVGQRGSDGGTDLLLRKGKQRAIVQCKQRRFPGGYVDVREVREFAGVITAGKLMKGFFVTSGVFTPEATEFAEKIPQLELIDGAELLVMFGHCPKCRASIEPKHGKYGVFLSCVRYPECDGALNLAA
jgi:ssDNA-binding Zn-finger/Zn-ribbon topoisomerase 1